MNSEIVSRIYPPRPEQVVARSMFAHFERAGFAAQAKKNGQNNVLGVTPERKLFCNSRHLTPHDGWEPTVASSAAFADLPGDGWYVFSAELLHNKIKGGPKDTNFIHDILVADGKFLRGTTFAERQKLLAQIFLQGGEAETASHFVINDKTWLAKTIITGFAGFMDSLGDPREDEGIVLKKLAAPLASCARASTNSSWMVKCRHPAKNYCV